MAIVTNKSLKLIDGTPCVVWNGYQLRGRPAARSEDGLIVEETELPKGSTLKDYAPTEGREGYLRLPNIMIRENDAPQELMLACEYFDHPIVSPWVTGANTYRNAPVVIDEIEAGDLLDALGVVNPTRTARTRAKEAIGSWCYEGDVSAAIPVKDIVAMSSDLRAVITMLIYSIGGACTADMLEENVPPSLMMLKQEPGCYDAFISRIPSWLLHGGTAQMAQHYEDVVFPEVQSESRAAMASQQAKWTINEFCNELITAMMANLAATLSPDGFFATGEYASLGGAYAFWAREAICGKAAVCETCGRLFIRKRSSGRFCGGACRERSNSKRG